MKRGRRERRGRAVIRTVLVILSGCLLATLLPTTAAAESAEEALARGNQAYESGEFETARNAYESAISLGAVHETAFYNLGCAHARLGNRGPAILAFRRALWLDPAHEDARANLSWLRGQSAGTDEEEAPTAGTRDRVARWTAFVPVRAAITLAAVLEWVAAACLVLAFTARRRGRRVAGLLATGIVLVVLAGLFGGAALARSWAHESERGAVVLASRVDARSGPAQDQQALFTLHEGHEVDVLLERPRWLRIRTSEGLTGWLPKASCEPVRLEAGSSNAISGQGHGDD